ncbi:hypothetical protein B9479_006211 [Cryptococcus floricola]|uniref:Uncharacterized protein n=1 Tax=Cryptococcus floricola TaxID=2591691 RepID=A0A5D3ASP8_9TREE|nr:hypothetical protein B9479_006211 [Cryptococcus floricola]
MHTANPPSLRQAGTSSAYSVAIASPALPPGTHRSPGSPALSSTFFEHDSSSSELSDAYDDGWGPLRPRRKKRMAAASLANLRRGPGPRRASQPSPPPDSSSSSSSESNHRAPSASPDMGQYDYDFIPLHDDDIPVDPFELPDPMAYREDEQSDTSEEEEEEEDFEWQMEGRLDLFQEDEDEEVEGALPPWALLKSAVEHGSSLLCRIWRDVWLVGGWNERDNTPNRSIFYHFQYRNQSVACDCPAFTRSHTTCVHRELFRYQPNLFIPPNDNRRHDLQPPPVELVIVGLAQFPLVFSVKKTASAAMRNDSGKRVVVTFE